MSENKEAIGIELRVSSDCYNEVALALERAGKKVNRDAAITLTKDEKLIDPIDWRKVAVRKDATEVAAKVYAEADEKGEQTSKNFVKFAEEVYQFILTGTQPGENKTKTIQPVKVWK